MEKSNAGVNNFGFGYGDTDDRGGNSGEMGDNLPYVDAGGVVQLSLGESHTCALQTTEKSNAGGITTLVNLG